MDNRFVGKIITAYRKNVILPNNLKTEIDLVNHPGGACILAVNNNEKVILLKQFRATIEKYIWEIPAGKLEHNEDPLICAKRELEEEAGYETDDFKKVFEFYSTPGFCNEILHIYEARNLKKIQARPEENEIIEVHEFSKDEIKKMLSKNEIEDSKTLIALLYWLQK